MMLEVLASGAAGAPTQLNPVELFLHADIVVKAVMGGLVLASVWVWTIIVGFQKENGKRDVASARVVNAALGEWRRSTSGRTIDREGTRQRLSLALEGAVTAESDALAGRLNFLATVGSVAPFVGLFGTVWGVMDSFFNIGAQQNSSLAVVAPGISEALLATAIGLFAAIPAVVAYNRFSHRVNRFEARLFRFADRFQATLSRELEQ